MRGRQNPWRPQTPTIIQPNETPQQLVADAHVAAVDAVEAAVREEQIECDFSRLDGYLFPHDDSRAAAKALDKELDAALRAGVCCARVRVCARVCVVRVCACACACAVCACVLCA